ncbi:MAG: glycerol-3-phosphate 1-O-acyltransferase PlsY [Clostridiales bacterium]|nr:glycerol-3-phosphate 1-O-acyltransferase PlsY [Clostridiales bacterium]MCI6588583.1 glycerol-3-phosphate 1-O-acyltransferase PlsY [Clostridiales bacterium]MDY3833314.1 glycerol-3-phosphate 1-O-acyltransferase PlsY [Candidatus Ventricola sp.]MDY4541173.1 glycerol-3-phosphate 1-O-acyltransferase PlsY [Candidatus Ventricola sp.]MDY4854498.1 glycerol-3-phosphate 1-O-acyltransferase PlsY [Candidatus Ventricola sp.]
MIMTRNLLSILIVIVAGYLLGSISTGVVLSRLFAKTDIRSQGSGNAGTTNMLRVLGRKMALLTFIGDMLKGIIAVFIGKWLIGGELGGLLGVVGAVLGHYYPLYFGFKGGKGIATSFGSLLFVFPVQALLAFAVFLILVAVTHYVSVGSIAAAITLPLLIVITRFQEPTLWIITVCIGASVVWRHRANIKRLMNHTENKLDFSTLKGKKK